MGEHLPYKEGVTGSSPVPPIAKSMRGEEGVKPDSPNADRTFLVVELTRDEAIALTGCWGFPPKAVDAAESAVDKLAIALDATRAVSK